MASDQGSSVTLILYSIDPKWYMGTEPFLNLLAAAAQFSTFTHVELAIGEDSGAYGEMSNVLRIFNDATGVELCQRTGKNPQYQYCQIGCSKKAELAMLAWARQQMGKPFSSVGMARALLWPRQSDGTSWYCAELIAACLQVGGLMSRDSKTGAATPHSLYKMYKSCGAVQANPCTLRQQFGMRLSRGIPYRPISTNPPPTTDHQATSLNSQQFNMHSLGANAQNALNASSASGAPSASGGTRTHRSDSPPRAAFRVLQPRGPTMDSSVRLSNVTLSLSSLNMKR